MGKETSVKKSKKQHCSITLRELESQRNKFSPIDDNEAIDSDTYKELVLFSPSKQSNLGDKLSKKILKHIDELVNEIVKGLDIKHKYFYSSYESKKADNVDLSQSILKDTKTFFCMYCSDNFSESIYASVRNALAHGNIVKKGQFVYLYSLASRNDKQLDEKDKKISFLLKVHDLKNLHTYVDAFKKFN